jgi:hypothetical protein
MTDIDLSWMNVPGPDGVTFAQRQQRVVPPSGGGTDDQNNAYNDINRF